MNRPYVLVNCAMSVDGKIGLPWRKQYRFSSDDDMKRVYHLRHQYDAVLVGSGTVLADDPKLTVKEKYVTNPKQPLRVVLDSRCRVPQDALVVNDAAPTLLISRPDCTYAYRKAHVDMISCDTLTDGLLDIEEVLQTLFAKGIKKLLVEGGGQVIWSFLNQQLVDKLSVYIAPVIIGGDKTPTMADGDGIKKIDEIINLTLISSKQMNNGLLLHYSIS